MDELWRIPLTRRALTAKLSGIRAWNADFPKKAFEIRFLPKKAATGNITGNILDACALLYSNFLLNNPAMSESLFKIHAPSIDTASVEKKIEEQIAKSGLANGTELRAVEALDFQPESAADAYGFDPALTAELFERPVELPDFRSRKYRFLVGPLRYLASRIYRWLSQHFQRSARNMGQAFYALVHEQIYVRHRLLLLEENLRFLTSQNTDQRDASILQNKKRVQFAPPPLLAKAQVELLSALEIPRQGRLLLLEDPNLYFLPALLKHAPKSVEAHTPHPALSGTWHSEKNVKIHIGNAAAVLSGLSDDSLDGIFIADLSNWSLEPDAILAYLPRKLKPGGLLAVLYLEPQAKLGFERKSLWKIQKASFLSELEKSLELKKAAPISGASENSFFAIFCKK